MRRPARPRASCSRVGQWRGRLRASTFWEEVKALDNVAEAQTQIGDALGGRQLIERDAVAVRNLPARSTLASTIESFTPGVGGARRRAPGRPRGPRRRATTHSPSVSSREAYWQLAPRAAGAGASLAAVDVVEIAGRERRLELVIAPISGSGSRFALSWLRDRIPSCREGTAGGPRARRTARGRSTLQRVLTIEVLLGTRRNERRRHRASSVVGEHSAAVERYLRLLADIRASRSYDVATLSVALREARNLLRGT